MIRLLFVDVDGTLVGPSGQVSDEVWEKASVLRTAGLRIALATGRPAFGTVQGYADRLDPQGWHIYQNGAHLQGFGRSVSTPLSPQVVTRIIEHARSNATPLELYTSTDYAVELDCPTTRDHAALLGTTFVAETFDKLWGPTLKAQWLVREGDDNFWQELSFAWGVEITTSKANAMPGVTFVNLTSRGVSKASGIKAVAELYNIPLHEAAYVGDSQNDLDALRLVGLPIAVEGASLQVKKAAKSVVPSILQALELVHGASET